MAGSQGGYRDLLDSPCCRPGANQRRLLRGIPREEKTNSSILDSDATRPTSDSGADREQMLDACTQWSI
jgi:hypothetical protein